MKIDINVAAAARHFGGGESDAVTWFERLIQAVVIAEGNILRAVQDTYPNITDVNDALDITCRSAVHAMGDFIAAGGGDQTEFVHFWAKRWAPVGAANDPHGLNANWPGNVLKGLTAA